MTGLGPPTIARGRRELAALLDGTPIKKERKPVSGRPRIEQKYPAITAMLEEMLSDEVAGDAMGEQKWVRSSVAKLTGRLRAGLQLTPAVLYGHEQGQALSE